MDDDAPMDSKQDTAFDLVAAGVEAVSLQCSDVPSTASTSDVAWLPCDKHTLSEQMLNQVAESDAHFRHQQRGEPDLTHEEKVNIVRNLVLNKPAIFLSRFGKHLSAEHLCLFDSLHGDYVVDFHLEQIRKYQNESKNTLLKRNRRFEAMNKLVEKGEYFSEEQMKHRNPLQYDQMIGQFLNDDEIADRIDKSDASFANLLLSQMDMQYLKSVYDKQKDIEDSQMEEEDEEEDQSDITCPNHDKEEDGPVLCDAEKEALRNEFMRNMQLQFLNGEDSDFNYSDVDYNVEYDSVAIRDRDEEEKYFDDDDDAAQSNLQGTTLQNKDINTVGDTGRVSPIQDSAMASDVSDTSAVIVEQS